MRVCIATLSLLLVSSFVAADETATLNLNNADIRILINTVSEATGKNFIIDPRVKAKVTVVSAKPMNKDEIYEVFLSILDVHGFAAVPGEDDGIIKIVPDVNAKQSAVPTGYSKLYEGTDQLETRVLQLQNVAANQLVPILRPLVPQQGHLAAYTPTNVLVITDRASNIKRLLKVIQGIDRADQTEIEIVKLNHASATDVVRTINVLMQQQAKDKGGQTSLMLTTDERTNSILVTGDANDRKRVLKIIDQLDTEMEISGNTKVVFLKYSVAADLVSILQGISSRTLAEQQGQTASPQGAGKDVDIQADEANNALVITAQPSMIQQLESIIRQLDIPRAQILIEAIIAEVSTDLASELGTQFLVNGAENGDGPAGGGFFPKLAGDLSGLAANPAAITGSEGLNIAFGKTSGSNQFAFVLRALKGDAATNILSTPTLVTLDNVEAEIVFGQNVPFVTGSYSNTGGVSGAANPFQTIERQDVGLTMKIKPQVNEGDAIKLEIEQEISSLATSAVATSDVVTNKRSIKTEVLVDDGQTIVLGGLIEDTFSDTRQKVPLLGSIPILGRLFSYTKTQKIKRNLMVFIRPVILKDSLSADYFTSQKYNLLKARQLEAKIGERGLIRDPAAELPEIEVLFAPLPKKSEAPAD
ncbi:MAG: type II secretion system secretin GspD [Gammaproteobacteria bacterium]|nr:type II secretion system secretin GspD [Gammaproteobacteria bacterium]